MPVKRRKRKSSCLECGCLGLVSVTGLGVLFVLVLFVLVSAQPGLAAQGADTLRAIFGDQAVSYMEMAVFQAQDAFHKLTYDLGLVTPAAPWQPEPSVTPQIAVDRLPTLTPEPTPAITAATSTPIPPTPTPVVWQPGVVTASGGLAGEGQWADYIQNAQGVTVAKRAFVQPDPSRPYAIVAIVAFDLAQTRLHFVLGSVEPYAPNLPARSGAIPAADKAPGVLLATFNGGFKSRHGHFGAMSDGITALPAREGYATLFIAQDGTLQMGEWGSEVTPGPQVTAWRQNGPFVVHQGLVSPKINENSPQDWGYTVTDVAPTWRSGLGLSADRQTLYYFCGSALSMEMLAKSMLAVQGLTDGMQLDINTYWVHFVAAREVNGQRQLEALFPDMMKENIDRYLMPYTRDYFYVTTRTDAP
jgi:hypothetical protein